MITLFWCLTVLSLSLYLSVQMSQLVLLSHFLINDVALRPPHLESLCPTVPALAHCLTIPALYHCLSFTLSYWPSVPALSYCTSTDCPTDPPLSNCPTVPALYHCPSFVLTYCPRANTTLQNETKQFSAWLQVIELAEQKLANVIILWNKNLYILHLSKTQICIHYFFPKQKFAYVTTLWNKSLHILIHTLFQSQVSDWSDSKCLHWFLSHNKTWKHELLKSFNRFKLHHGHACHTSNFVLAARNLWG